MRRATQSLTLEHLEVRRLLSAAIEPIDGIGNNIAHPTWGSTGIDLLRLSPASYSDGISSPSLASNPSARTISNLVNSQTDPSNPTQELNTLDSNNMSDFGYAFGQFIDHDLDLTPDGGDSFPIQLSANDPIGLSSLAFTRSQYDPATGTSISNPRQQVTEITAYLDLSQVYGSDSATANALRTMSGGKLKTSAGGLLPYDNTTYFTSAQLSAINSYVGGMANESGVPTSSLFVTGDIRGNENLELTALETLFVRNHNMLAGKLQAAHPTWTDEQLYQEARKINIAGYQAMIYNEYIPALLGQNAIGPYRGYNPMVNPGISTEFSTVAFRMGHSMVSPSIARQGNNGQDVADEVSLAYDFFDPYLLSNTGSTDPYTGLVSTDIGPVLKGEADGNGQKMDNMAVDEIRNLLFANGPGGGDDLIARDIQRGRDDGIGSYNTVRVAMGLPAVTSFAQITSNVTVQKELAAAYPGGVNTIDSFEGGLCEDPVRGSDVGPLFQAIIVDQFSRLRAGDRFFYQNENLNPEEMNLFNQVNSLTKVIEANTDVTNLQPNAFIYTASINGAVLAPGGMGVPGKTVSLVDSSGDTVATALTDPMGHYHFDQQSGMGTGVYTLTINNAGKIVSSSPVAITAGGQNVQGVTLMVSTPPVNTTPPRPAPPPMGPPPQPPMMHGLSMQDLLGAPPAN